MNKFNSLESLLIHELQDLYSAEMQLVKALPKVARKASSPELKSAVKEHLAQTEGHITRLEQAFQLLGCEAKSDKCKGMQGLLKEAAEVMKYDGSPATLDAALIVAAQKVEHYEIAAYGSAAKFADRIGRADVKQLLGQTLAEEEQTDKKLTSLAESGINQRAAESRDEAALAE